MTRNEYADRGLKSFVVCVVAVFICGIVANSSTGIVEDVMSALMYCFAGGMIVGWMTYRKYTKRELK
jgi:hypothetical protein